MIRFDPVQPIRPPQAPDAAGAARPTEAFSAAFSSALRTVDSGLKSAEAEVRRFLEGESVDIHQVAMATQQSQLAFELFLQMRNKVVQAYQEIMRMQL